MSQKKPTLGRSLAALMPSTFAQVQPAAAGAAPESRGTPAAGPSALAPGDELAKLPLDLLQRGKYQPRLDMRQETLQELADSIKAAGVLQPAVVRKRDVGFNAYELVAGERRWRAARLAGLETLPCVVRDLDDLTVLKIQTIENLQREDIHPLDEADGYARLIQRAGYDVEHLAQEVGRSASYVYQRLKLKDLIPEARKRFIEGAIQAGHAILMARLQPPEHGQSVRGIAHRLVRGPRDFSRRDR